MTIKVPLTATGINRAIRELERYRQRLPQMAHEIAARLAQIGLEQASIGFRSAMYDGVNDSSVSVRPTENGYEVTASGNAVCYIEFGAGVHFNPSDNYPIPKPAGIVGPGQFGKGWGAEDSWLYKGEPGTNGVPIPGTPYISTQGNPAQMPMYHALESMQPQVERIVREVFASAG